MIMTIINNSLKFREKNNALLNPYQTENHFIIDEKIYKKNINKNKLMKNKNKDQELISDVENKENIMLQNSNLNNNRINDLNTYVLKQNENNRNSIKAYQRIINLDLYKKKINRNSINSNDYNYNVYINQNNGHNYEIRKKILNNEQFKYKNCGNNEGHLTDRFQSNFINKNIIKTTDYNLIENKPLTERELNKSNYTIYNNVSNNVQLLPKNNSGKKTLILDLDETLVHSSFKPFNNVQDDFVVKINSLQLNNKINNNSNKSYIIHVLKRPYVGVFLSIICDIFEVVVFTASIIDYANPIIDEIDIEKKIKYRLFREHCIQINKDRYIKNLHNLGRDLKNVIIIDNNPLSYSLNLDNGLPISTWETNKKDNELIKIIPLLQYLSRKNITDVRPIIKRIVKNNIINYDEVNKIINYNNKIINLNYITKEKEEPKINNSNNDIYKISKNLSLKGISQKYNVENNNQNDNTNNNTKIQNNDNSKYHINKSFNNINNILKETSFNKNQMFIKRIRNLKLNNCKKYFENPKSRSFQDNEDNNNNNNNNNKTIHSRNIRLSHNFMNTKIENENENDDKIDNTFNDIIKKNKTSNNKSLIENRKKEINIPLPIGIAKVYSKNRNNLLAKKILYQKKTSRIYLKKDNNSKRLIKNNSDLNCTINNNKLTKEIEPNSNIINILKYPNLKNNLLYHKLFYNNYYNKKEKKNNPSIIKINSRNKIRKIMLDNKDKKDYKWLSFHFKNNSIDLKKENGRGLKNHKNHNHSLEYYLNNKVNLEILDNNIDKLMARFKINTQKKENDECKEKKINFGDRRLKENKSFTIMRNVYNLKYENRSLKDIKNDYSVIKHSFTVFNNNNKLKEL